MILFLIVLSLIIGINLKSHLIIALAISLLLLIILIRKKKYLLLIMSIFFILSGLGISFISFHFEADIYEGFVVESKNNYFILLARIEKFYVYEKDNKREIGDYLVVKGKSEPISFNKIESSFDFEKYLKEKGVYYQINSEDIEIKFSNPLRLKETQKDFLAHFEGDSKSLISSLLFSIHDDSEIIKQAESLHITRLLNLSGIHIYAFMWIFNTLFIFVFKKKKWVELSSLVLLGVFSIFTFPKIGVIRLMILFIIRFINRYVLKNKLTYISTISLCCAIMLIFDINLAKQSSFLLGFMIPLFIYLARNSFTRIKGIKQKLFISMITYIFFIPFEISYFNGINLISLPLTIIYSPLVILISFSGLLCFFHIPIYAVSGFFTDIFKGIINISTRFNINIYAPEMNPVMICAFYAIFISLLYLISIKFKPLIKYPIIGLSSLLIIYFLPISNSVSTEVTFINVGQGDSCLIRKGNHTVLIDTGGLSYLDIARDSLIPYFKKKRIYQIDKLIVTHDDFDHMGGVENLKKYFHVSELIKEKDAFPFSYLDTTFYNYNTFADSSDENYNSLVIGFKLHSINYLITGDAPKEIEEKIMDTYQQIDCDILKVGHHGSNTSSSDKFIKYLSPYEAIISCGKNNWYGHPHKEVIDILNKYSVTIRRTDIEGSITYFHYGL